MNSTYICYMFHMYMKRFTWKKIILKKWTFMYLFYANCKYTLLKVPINITNLLKDCVYRYIVVLITTSNAYCVYIIGWINVLIGIFSVKKHTNKIIE